MAKKKGIVRPGDVYDLGLRGDAWGMGPADVQRWKAAVKRDPCSYCGGPGGIRDHVVSVATGGTDAWWNAAGICSLCNNRKGKLSVMAHLLWQAWRPEIMDLRAQLDAVVRDVRAVGA